MITASPSERSSDGEGRSGPRPEQLSFQHILKNHQCRNCVHRTGWNSHAAWQKTPPAFGGPEFPVALSRPQRGALFRHPTNCGERSERFHPGPAACAVSDQDLFRRMPQAPIAHDRNNVVLRNDLALDHQIPVGIRQHKAALAASWIKRDQSTQNEASTTTNTESALSLSRMAFTSRVTGSSGLSSRSCAS